MEIVVSAPYNNGEDGDGMDDDDDDHGDEVLGDSDDDGLGAESGIWEDVDEGDHKGEDCDDDAEDNNPFRRIRMMKSCMGIRESLSERRTMIDQARHNPGDFNTEICYSDTNGNSQSLGRPFASFETPRLDSESGNRAEDPLQHPLPRQTAGNQ